MVFCTDIACLYYDFDCGHDQRKKWISNTLVIKWSQNAQRWVMIYSGWIMRIYEPWMMVRVQITTN